MELGAGISYQSVNQSFSSLGGLPLLDWTIEQLNLKRKLDSHLLRPKIATKTSSLKLWS